MAAYLNDIITLFSSLGQEATHFFAGVSTAAASGHVAILVVCLLLAFGFEFVNGFHDTANAVATVIYTHSLKPWTAVIWAGICNFLGVFIGGTVVAMAIVKLIPPDLIVSADLNITMAFIFSLLMSAVIWNLGTWYFGIPASSSHTLIGSILGIGIGHSLLNTGSIVSGVNWSKAADVGLALLISPLVGFGLGVIAILAFKYFYRDPSVHHAPESKAPPPWPIRAALIATSTGVSFAHGSNDGQKGVGLVMLILIALMPAQFALRPDMKVAEIRDTLKSAVQLPEILSAAYLTSQDQKMGSNAALKIDITLLKQVRASEESVNANAENADLAKIAKINTNVAAVKSQLVDLKDMQTLDGPTRLSIRNQIFILDKSIGDLEKTNSKMTKTKYWGDVKKIKARALKLTDYVPLMVLILVALSLGLGTTIGWKRVVVTIGERIGKDHLTYAQGAAAQFVAMGTIGLSTLAGFPVSTTHILSSGVAGAMVGNGRGIQLSTVKKILSAWILTLPATIFLSSAIYCLIVTTFLK
jgi:phosphate/sulfate permease